MALILDAPPQLILPDHYQANRPAIIRAGGDLASYFPVELDRKTRRAIVAELNKRGLQADVPTVRELLDGKKRRPELASIPFGMFDPGISLPSVTYVTQLTSTADASSYTYTSAAIGDDAGRSLVVVVVHSSQSSSSDVVTSCSIGGTNGTKHFSTGAGNPDVAIFSRAVPSGTTATIIVTLSTSDNRSAIGIYALYNLTSTTPVDVDNTTGSGTLSRTIDVQKDGITIVGCSGNSGAAKTPTNYTEAYEVDVEANDGYESGYDVATTTGTRTYSCTNAIAFGCVSWR